jgi:glutamate 5-kinase
MSVAHVLDQSQTIIIKIGTALVAEKDGSGVKQDWLKALTQDVAALIKAGKRVAIVSSGGVALGRPALGISPDTPPKNIPLEHKQAASAVGQHHVFNGYHGAFEALGITAAQVLLTMAETENRRMHLNARATLQALLDKGIVPVINENDTISTEEIRFGDNDRLAVRVGQMIGADCVILLSTIDGLYTANPHKDSTAAHIPVIEVVTNDHMAMAGDAVPGLSTGGMKSKMEAASAAMRAGISMVIADGMAAHSLRDIATATATLFHAKNTSDSQRKKWISAHMKPKGWVMLDNGALDALRDGKSLLPVGVKTISGDFERGDAVEIKAPDGTTLGVGLTAYSAYDAKQLLGKRSSEIMEILGFAGRKELVHRNDMALVF